MELAAGMIFGILCMIGWGTADFFAKKAIDKVGAYRAFFWVYLLGYLVLLASFIILPKTITLTPKLIGLFALGGFVTCIGYFSFYKGLEKGYVSIISPIVACNLLIVVLLSIVILQESLSVNRWIGVGVCLLGLILVSWPKKFSKGFQKGIPHAFVTLITWGISIFMLGYLTKQFGWFETAVLFRFSVLVFAFIMLPHCKERVFQFPKKMFWTIMLVGLLEVLGTVSFNYGVSQGLVAVIGPIASLFPAVTLVLAWLFLKEKLTWVQKSGVGSILVGLVLLAI